jgi:hypothetical protein
VQSATIGPVAPPEFARENVGEIVSIERPRQSWSHLAPGRGPIARPKPTPLLQLDAASQLDAAPPAPSGATAVQ